MAHAINDRTVIMSVCSLMAVFWSTPYGVNGGKECVYMRERDKQKKRGRVHAAHVSVTHTGCKIHLGAFKEMEVKNE